MARALHLFDSATSPSALAVLNLLRRRRGDDVLARVGPPGAREDLPVPTEVIRRPGRWSLTVAAGIRRLAQRCGADVIHCWEASLGAAAAATGIPTLIGLYHRPRHGALEALRSAVGDRARIATGSAALAQWLTRHHVPGEAVHVVTPAAQAAGTDGDRPGWPGQEERLVVLAPMTHHADRGPYWAVWAVGILLMMEKGLYLVAPGTGPALEKARRLACEAGLRENTLFPGLPGEGPAAYPWSAADAAVLYEQDGSGLPAAAAAVAAGVPIVAADTGELAATFRHERTALLAKPRTPRLLASAIWRLRRDRAAARYLAVNAAADMPHLLDPTGMVAEFEQLYQTASPPA